MLFNLKNPASSGLTSGFDIKIYDQDYLIMQTESLSNFGVTIIPENLKNLKVTPDNYRTSAASSYSFSFILAN